MMSVIKVNEVRKTFRIYHEKNTTLKERIVYAGRTKYQEFLALDNISIEIEAGQTIGLIGKNGSGKSTLLKLLTQIIYPDSGSIEINGKVSSLLELGAGFHPDFSGRENIYMNASILGMSKKQIDQKLDDIIQFSELEDFVDQPVRSYSSGMYMRLAFSVAINVDPDILLIDEVLAVGDASFQRKCLNRIKELKSQGKTIVFVSHDMGVMEKLCDSIYWLHKGKIVEAGDPKRVLDAYLSYSDQNDEQRYLEEKERQEVQQGNNETQETAKEQAGERWGSLDIEISNPRLVDLEGKERHIFHTEDDLEIRFSFRIHREPESIVFGIGIFTLDNICAYGTNTYIDKVDLDISSNKGTVVFKIKNLPLLPGLYKLDVAVHSDDGVPYDYQRDCKRFEVRSLIQDTGVARIPHQWTVEHEERG